MNSIICPNVFTGDILIALSGRWLHGKLVVLDISESGKQIGEKLFVLLDEKRKTDLATFVLERKEEKNNFSEISCQIQDAIVEETNTRMHFTEIHEGGLYFCSEQRKVTVCGQEIDLTAKEFDALHLLITNRKLVMTFGLSPARCGERNL